VLNDFVLQGSYAQWPLSSMHALECRLSWKGALDRYPGARDCANSQPFVQALSYSCHVNPSTPACSFPLQGIEAVRKERHGYVV